MRAQKTRPSRRSGAGQGATPRRPACSLPAAPAARGDLRRTPQDELPKSLVSSLVAKRKRGKQH